METKEAIIQSLSLNERKILPLLEEKSIQKIAKDSGLEEVAVLRSLDYLGNKKIITLKKTTKKIIDLGVNGILYKQKGLPERRLLTIISEKKSISLTDAKKASELNDNEFQASLGALKKKALVNLINGILQFNGTMEEISRKTLEEQFIEVLPLEYEELKPEQKFAFESLKNRKNIVEVIEKTIV